MEKRGQKNAEAYLFGPGERGSLFAIAGLMENGTLALITCEPNETMAPIHHRMPAILRPEEYDAWLQGGDLDLLQPYDGEMYLYPVDKTLLKDHDGPECIPELRDMFSMSVERWSADLRMAV